MPTRDVDKTIFKLMVFIRVTCLLSVVSVMIEIPVVAVVSVEKVDAIT